MRPCRYIEFCVNTLLCAERNNSNVSDLSPPLLIDPFILSSLLKGCRLEKARLQWAPFSLLFRRRVMWLEPCDLHARKTLMHTGNNQGNAGRVQRNANIFRVLKKQYHTHAHRHTAKYYPPPTHPPTQITLSDTHTHSASCTRSTTMRTHTYITQQRNTQKKKQPAPWQNSPQVHLHKTLSLTKWLHLTSWVGGRTSPVAASYLQILHSFSRQATVSWPPL